MIFRVIKRFYDIHQSVLRVIIVMLLEENNMAFEKLKNFIAPLDDDDDEYEDDDNQYEEKEQVLQYKESETKPVSSYEATKTSVNSIPTNASMVLFEPRSFEEAEEIAKHLKNRKACVVNLHRLQREYAQRTIDFLTGVVFALDGTIQKIGHNVILCTPKNVNVTGDISLESDDD